MSTPAPVADEAARAAKMFADSVKAHEAADRAEAIRKQDAEEQGRLHERLRAAKTSAAERIKRLRASGGTRDQLADADAAYRRAAAELHEYETGERPQWAPAPEVGEAGADESRAVDEPAVDKPAVDEPAAEAPEPESEPSPESASAPESESESESE